jgi:hypothetical protein
MNDYHLDPPDYPDPPSCPIDGCEGWSENETDTEHGISCRCDECGHEWTLPYPVEPPDPPERIFVDCPDDLDTDLDRLMDRRCPHGGVWGDCDTCDHLSDIAYDEARERRFFGR